MSYWIGSFDAYRNGQLRGNRNSRSGLRELALFKKLLDGRIFNNVSMGRLAGVFEGAFAVSTCVSHLRFASKTVDLHWHHEGIGVSFHPHEPFIIIRAETNQGVCEIAEVVILFDFFRFILVI